MTTWQNRIVSSGIKPASDFLAHNLNWKSHPKFQQDAIEGSLDQIGWCKSVVESGRTGKLLDGHARIILALRRGDDTPVPYEVVDVSEQEEALILASLDPLAALAVVDKEKLDSLLRELPPVDARLQEMLAELAKKEGLYQASSQDAPEPEIDRAEELREKWGIEIGQVWDIPSKSIMGKCHRLMCGDSTNKENVSFLVGNDNPFIMVTDPPYGVEYDPSWRENFNFGRTSTGKVLNDDKHNWFEAWEFFLGDVAYVWHAHRFAADVFLSLIKAKFSIRSQIIWRKQTFVFGRGDYHWQHESCFYAVKNGKKSKWCGDRTQSTVWDIQNSNPMGGEDRREKTIHGTEKPLECMARPIRNHGERGDIVYDPFLGSGTTMIAAEQLKRTCFGMEISPAYVAVCLERMVAMGLSPCKAVDTEKSLINIS